MDRELLRSGDRALVRFRFKARPEYVVPGTRFVFREGRTKGIGVVIEPPEGGIKRIDSADTINIAMAEEPDTETMSP